ncbi:MAG TPA: O-antigen ligase family protein [Actinomycetota bacterium]|nr:O-antigen ligase family protein [Actinomycetota bacterium]
MALHATRPALDLQRSFLLLLVAASCAAVGAGLAFVGVRLGALGPLFVIGLPAAGILAALSFDRPLIGIAAIVISFPFGTIAIPTGSVTLQAVEVAVVLVTVVVALHRLARGTTMLPWTSHLWWYLALIGWTLIALPSAIDQALALKQIAQLVGGLLLATSLVAACRDMSDVRRLMTLFLAVAAGIAIVALLNGQQLDAGFGGSYVSGRAKGTFDQPNQLGSFSAVAALVGTGLILGARRWGERMLIIGCLIVVAGAMLLSLSRGAWIGAAGAALFLALALREYRRLILAVSIPLLVLGAMAGAIAPSNPQVVVVTQRVESLTVLSPYDNRPAIWAEAFREIRADPWTGQGPGSFPVASARASSEATTSSAQHAHNMWLTWAAESGLPGALILTGFIAALAVAGAQAARAATDARDRALVIGLCAGLIVIAGQGTVDYTLRNAVVFFSVWTVVGGLLASWRILTSRAPTSSVTAP